MTRRITTQRPEDDHYKVRVVISGAAVLHLASATEPLCDEQGQWHAEWLADSEKGDTVGFIDWSAVSAVTWRWTGVSELERLSEPSTANGHGIARVGES